MRLDGLWFVAGAPTEEGAQCGRVRTAIAMTATSCATSDGSVILHNAAGWTLRMSSSPRPAYTGPRQRAPRAVPRAIPRMSASPVTRLTLIPKSGPRVSHAARNHSIARRIRGRTEQSRSQSAISVLADLANDNCRDAERKETRPHGPATRPIRRCRALRQTLLRGSFVSVRHT
jgi:hypothetical protein